MDFVKKNALLAIVLAVTFVICATLLFLVYQRHGELKKSFAQLESIREEINNLIRQSPAPLKENLDRINDDSRVMKEKADEISRIFGQPNRFALQSFAAELGMTEDEISARFRDFWSREARKGSNRYQLLIKFKKEFDRAKLAKAIEAFMKIAQKETVEPLDDANTDDLLLASLGLPRAMSNVNCKTYMISKMQPNLVRFLEEEPFTSCNDVAKFSFEEFDNRMPLEENIPYILRHWTVIDDLVKRIKASGISSFDNLTKLNGLNGEIDREFLKFRYSITVTGSQNSIRALVNSLMDAYKTNRVYIIKNITMEKRQDEIKEITEGKETKTAARNPYLPPGIGREQAPQPGAPGSKPEDEENLPLQKRKDYGIIIFGNEKNIRAVIELEYVIYVASEYRI
ncbi:MAG: hypothetical protein A2020_15715 [Lentisphaerae bacterium GWF2_45_14]|nr:MAG: hypothetical protein A2020_15715 [Lentisphaerae bacterium GWF2_45_14]